MKKPRLPFILTVSGLGAALILVILYLGLLQKRPSWQVTIATGTLGGTYSKLGAEFARILEGLPDSPITDAIAKETAASVENIDLLAKDSVDIGFVMKPAISNATVDQLAQLRVLARLYMDVVQIVVRKEAGISNLTDLNAKKVYVGKEGSGTKIVAEKILDSLRVFPAIKVTEDSYDGASRRLVSGELDAAFFVAGTPTDAVKLALESGECELLDLGDIRDKITGSIPDLDSLDIPVNSYETQTKRVRTISADTFLLCRKDLETYKVLFLEKALFDNLERLLLAHAKARDIRLSTAFERLPEGINLHNGADEFRQKEEEKLLILTGALSGKYHVLGKIIKSLLEPYGINARVSHTDGSRENLSILKKRDPRMQPTIAILQYDVALASLGDPEHIYKIPLPEDIKIDTIKDLRRLATLHKETVHIMVRRDMLSCEQGSQPNLEALSNLRVCLGPEGSGTRILANVILAHHDIDLKSQILLPVPDMVDRIHSEEIDAGFFVSYVPSIAVKTILDNPEIRLLSLDPRSIVGIVGPAIDMTEIDQYEYACQLDGEPAVKTIATRAVLVTREDLPQAKKITKAIFEGEAFLNIEGGVETMKEELPSLPLHRDAEEYYEEAGLLPSSPPAFQSFFDWLAATWRFLAILVMVCAGYKGLIEFRRAGTRNRFARRILNIRLDAQDPVNELMNIREETLEAVRKKWYRFGELNQSRWRYLENLIDDRINLKKNRDEVDSSYGDSRHQQ